MNANVVGQKRFRQFLMRLVEMTDEDVLIWRCYLNTQYVEFRDWRLTLIKSNIPTSVSTIASPELELTFIDHMAMTRENVIFGGNEEWIYKLEVAVYIQGERRKTQPTKPDVDKQLRDIVSTENLFFIERFLLDSQPSGS